LNLCKRFLIHTPPSSRQILWRQQQ
jgi:hypothetical protein